jgi:hypothetical protein
MNREKREKKGKTDDTFLTQTIKKNASKIEKKNLLSYSLRKRKRLLKPFYLERKKEENVDIVIRSIGMCADGLCRCFRQRSIGSMVS